MKNRYSRKKKLTRSTTKTRTFLETCVLDADHKALEEHLVNNLVQQSDLDRCLLRGLRIVQRKETELSHVAAALTILLQFGAKWNSDDLLAKQKTPLHIICESPGDHHELLELMIKSSQRTIINQRDWYRRTALTYAGQTANMNCLRCLIINGVDMCSETSPNAIMAVICCFVSLDIIAQFIRRGVNINVRSWNYRFKNVVSPFEASVMYGRENVSLMLLISGCSRGVFHNGRFIANPKLKKMMKEWNLYDNNVIPLKQRCRRVILNHLSPQADKKIKKLPLPTCLIKFLSIPELDDIVC